MQKLPVSLIIAGLIASTATSCNDSKSDEDAKVVYGSTAITSFSLEKNDDVLARLDSVFFSIDLVNGLVFNADSLPVGTKVDRLIVNIGTPRVSACEITYNRGELGDTTINYLSNATDSIDFSHGPATVTIKSYDEDATRSYKVYVNVHQTEPDAMTWNSAAIAKLPSTLDNITASKTVMRRNGVACLSANATEAEIGTSANPGEGNWTITKTDLPQGARVNTFTASGDDLYITDSSENLHRSTDGGANWLPTGTQMTWIYAPYGNGIIGNVKRGTDYFLVTYPASTETKVPADMPIYGTSDPVAYSNKWMTGDLTVIVCGEKSDGSLSGDTWGYDGSSWQRLSTGTLPKLTGVSLFPYFSFRTDDRWVTTEYSALFAVGGRHESGLTTYQLYVSNDNGIHWHKGSKEIQMPGDTQPFYNAQAIVANTPMTSRTYTSAEWHPVSLRPLAPWWTAAPFMSRTGNPWDSWECPYVYIFGGYDMQGNAYNKVWRGVINRLTFKPLH